MKLLILEKRKLPLKTVAIVFIRTQPSSELDFTHIVANAQLRQHVLFFLLTAQ